MQTATDPPLVWLVTIEENGHKLVTPFSRSTQLRVGTVLVTDYRQHPTTYVTSVELRHSTPPDEVASDEKRLATSIMREMTEFHGVRFKLFHREDDANAYKP